MNATLLKNKLLCNKSSQLLANKVFGNPQHYRQKLLNLNLINGDINNFKGKTFICVSLTRFCNVGCNFCFFKSPSSQNSSSIKDRFNEAGMQNFISFCNAINLGYLLVSGGGEPMYEKKSILQIIRHVQSERIVLVTSADWAKSENNARKYLDDIYEQLSQRETKTTVTVRVSVDKEHASNIGLTPIINLIKIFKEKYKNNIQFDLQIHSLLEDQTIDKLILHFKDIYKIKREQVKSKRISDGKNALKIVPKQELIYFDDFMIKVGYAKIFYSDLKIDLLHPEKKLINIDVYQKDLFESEDGNSATVTNKLGEPGLDFWVNFNGNVTTWGNQFLDNLLNLYVDTPEKVIKTSLQDPATLAYIEKGAIYRDNIVSEASSIAVLRSKAVNIRDYTGALMFDEARTRLYFTIRVLQDYISEGRISTESLAIIPQEIKDLLKIDKNILITAYKHSSYTIVQQVIESGDKTAVYDLIEWIKLGHYDVSDLHLQKLIDFYNKNVSTKDKIESIEAFKTIDTNDFQQLYRMTEYLSHIKPEALNYSKQPLAFT